MCSAPRAYTRLCRPTAAIATCEQAQIMKQNWCFCFSSSADERSTSKRLRPEPISPPHRSYNKIPLKPSRTCSTPRREPTCLVRMEGCSAKLHPRVQARNALTHLFCNNTRRGTGSRDAQSIGIGVTSSIRSIFPCTGKCSNCTLGACPTQRNVEVTHALGAGKNEVVEGRSCDQQTVSLLLTTLTGNRNSKTSQMEKQTNASTRL